MLLSAAAEKKEQFIRQKQFTGNASPLTLAWGRRVSDPTPSLLWLQESMLCGSLLLEIQWILGSSGCCPPRWDCCCAGVLPACCSSAIAPVAAGCGVSTALTTHLSSTLAKQLAVRQQKTSAKSCLSPNLPSLVPLPLFSLGPQPSSPHCPGQGVAGSFSPQPCHASPLHVLYLRT